VTRLALIGYGAWGRNYHRTVDSLRDVSIHSVCRLRPELTPSGIRERVAVTSDLTEALRGADAAVVATPPSSHREVACACLEAGLPVMLEKPVALSLEDSDAIFAASERVGIPVLVNNVHLFSTAFEALRTMTRSWYPVEIESEGGGPGPFRDYSALLDYGPHDVSMALSVLGGPPDSSSVRRVPSPSGEVWRISLSAGRSSASSTVGSGLTSRRRRFEVRCGARVAVYDDMARRKLTVDGRPVSSPDEPPLKRAVLAFHRLVRTGTVEDWRLSPGMNSDVMRVLLGAPAVAP
jgi:predicted dehydrogenase